MTTTLKGNSRHWLNSKEAADYLRTTHGGLFNLVHRRQIQPYRLGRKLLFKRSDLDRVIETSRKRF